MHTHCAKCAVLASCILRWHRCQHMENQTAGMDHKPKGGAISINLKW